MAGTVANPKYLFRKHPRAYKTWSGMKDRCQNSNHASWRNYGGRGIKVCARWQKFANFLADMGDPPVGMSIDRWPDRDGYYELGNCRWATPKQQANNTRVNHRMSARGEVHTLREWSEITGLSEDTIHNRLRNGWSDEDALIVKGPWQEHLWTRIHWLRVQDPNYAEQISERKRLRGRKRARRQRQVRRSTHPAKGLCIDCSRRAIKGRSVCEWHAEKRKLHRMRAKRRLRGWSEQDVMNIPNLGLGGSVSRLAKAKAAKGGPA